MPFACLHFFNLISLDCSSSEDMDFRVCWQPEHWSRIPEVVFLITKMLSMTHGNHALKLVTLYGVVHHSEWEGEPQSCCWHSWPVSVETARTVPDCSPGRRKEAKESGEPCTLVDELHACCELKHALLSALSSTWKFFLARGLTLWRSPCLSQPLQPTIMPSAEIFKWKWWVTRLLWLHFPHFRGDLREKTFLLLTKLFALVFSIFQGIILWECPSADVQVTYGCYGNCAKCIHICINSFMISVSVSDLLILSTDVCHLCWHCCL